MLVKNEWLRAFVIGALIGGYVVLNIARFLFHCSSAEFISQYEYAPYSPASRGEATAIIGANKNEENQTSKSANDVRNLSRNFPIDVRCPIDWKTNSSAAEKLECRNRLPDVIGIGVSKCGTGALSFFLDMHPYLVHSHKPKEVYFWNDNFNRGMDWYRDIMPVSSKYQLTMEKTPTYIRDKRVPLLIKSMLPSTTKFIVVVRDPVLRLVSSYVHNIVTGGKPLKRALNPAGFKKTFLSNKGDVKETNTALRHGLYDELLRAWLEVFPRDRFLVVDGHQLETNPLPVLQEVEYFLALPKYFDESKIYFDKTKGFYCKHQLDGEDVCMREGKGRPHPFVAEDVERKLKDFYHPHNLIFERMVGKSFTWA
ncbi:heparan sulfate glucosamine 3-O-sulfotransferase 1-like [Diadema antillarum]|uniref:heparan sulfate glucosamine 3-O-sulfotransferase 1-like n=1 Tax=Diadema antillarum TaxID=105358 RepID=UPI003A859229